MERKDNLLFDYSNGVLEGISRALYEKWHRSFFVRKEAMTYGHSGNSKIEFVISILYIDGECLQFSFDTWLAMMEFAIWLMKGDPNVTPNH